MRAMDRALCAAQQDWPVWKSCGWGGDFPSRKVHRFDWHSLMEGARLDFCRGDANDDLQNVDWEHRVAARVPQYMHGLWQEPATRRQKGNAIEQAIGVAWAAATGGAYLKRMSNYNGPQQLEFSSGYSLLRWRTVWYLFEELGFGPEVPRGNG